MANEIDRRRASSPAYLEARKVGAASFRIFTVERLPGN